MEYKNLKALMNKCPLCENEYPYYTTQDGTEVYGDNCFRCKIININIELVDSEEEDMEV